VTSSIGVLTMQLPCLNVLYDLFYPSGVKTVPLLILDMLTAVGLAHWIMGDGSRQGSGLHLNVYGFDPASVDRLMHVLTVKFGLICTVHGHSAGPRIYVHKESMPRLRELVLPHMVPMMHYKLGL
jgi:hypothetical protein